MESDVKGTVRFFTRLSKIDNGGFIDDAGYLTIDGRQIVHQSEVALRGLHNLENLLAAFTAVEGDVSEEIMAKVAREFKGVEHRIEFVREVKGVKYYNDSIASSPTRTIA